MYIKPGTEQAVVLDRALAAYLRYLSTEEAVCAMSAADRETHRETVYGLQQRRRQEERKRIRN